MIDLNAISARARAALCIDDDFMVAIGGGNPYYHCKHCSVTNVDLNKGKSSKSHAEWCDTRKRNKVPEDTLALVAEVERLHAVLMEIEGGSAADQPLSKWYQKLAHAALSATSWETSS